MHSSILNTALGSTYIFDTVQTIKLWRRKTTVKLKLRFDDTEAEFKEFEPWLKFKSGLKYGWFYLKLYSIIQDLSRRSIETGFWGI